MVSPVTRSHFLTTKTLYEERARPWEQCSPPAAAVQCRWAPSQVSPWSRSSPRDGRATFFCVKKDVISPEN